MKRWAVPLALLLLALLVRLPALGGFITIDEPRWIDRSRWFLSGVLFPQQECPPVDWGRDVAAQGWSCTLQVGYPGVTTMWAGSLGLLLHHRQTAPEVDLQTFLQQLSIYALDPGMIPPTRLPLAIAGALFVPLFYLLVLRLFSTRVAVVASLLVTLHPFHIALSRVLHHDVFNATFMVLSILALTAYWLRDGRGYWLPVSAVLAGLAFLSKQVSWFLLPYVAGLAAWTLYYRWQTAAPIRFWRLAAEVILWGLIAGLTFIALFPAMWVIPLEVLQAIFVNTAALAGEGHPHYFLGEMTNNPGWLFYPVGWLLRATPFEVVGVLTLALVALLTLIRQRSVKKLALKHPVKVALGLFVALFYLFVSMPDKKLVRYFLPAFPMLDIFAALGLFWLWDRPANWSAKIRPWAQQGALVLAGLVLIGQGWAVLNHFPYYFTYHNPLFGGAPGAARVMTLVGWGEGLNEAAAYLNRQPHADKLQVVVERYCGVFRPFFAGRVSCLNSSVGGILQADYLVYYYNVVQRDLAWPEQWVYFQHHQTPAHTVRLHGLDYVTVYKNPIRHPVDREANSLPQIFATFGYNLSPGGELTLFWQNLNPGSRELLIGVAPSRGVYAENQPVNSAGRMWVACMPKPEFAAEINTPKTVIESACPLNSLNLPPGLYDAQLAVQNDTGIIPLAFSRLAVLQVNRQGNFEHVDLATGAPTSP